MNTKIKTFAKGGIATATVGAMALAGATPAQAEHRDDGISVGDVIAGAVIIGGIAAVASAASKNRGYGYDDGSYRTRNDGYYRDRNDGYYRDREYNRGDRWGYRASPRAAVEKCVNQARNQARRSGYRYAQVTDVRDVQDTRYGWKVKGRIMVDGQYRDGRYDRYGYYDRDNRYSRWDNQDSGTFTCYVERGRVADVDFDGIRGLR